MLVSQEEIQLSTKVQQLKVEEPTEVKDVGHTKRGDHDQVVGGLHTEDLRQKMLEEQFPLAKARGPDFLPPQSRVSGLFPGKASVGRACKLQTNHFPVSLKMKEGKVHMYDVYILPPWNREY